MNELARKRKELGLTQEHVAKIAGVSRRTYQMYEEKPIVNETYNDLYKVLDDIANGYNFILSLKTIKTIVRKVLSEYKEVHSAYLFGSYARGEATGRSDIDLLIVSEPMGMKLFEIGPRLEDLLGKSVDLHTHRQLMKNETFIKEVLSEGIRIYS